MTIVYVIFIVLAVLYSIRYDRMEEYNSHKTHRFWLLCGYLICIAGFRYGVGGDTLTLYMRDFEKIPTDMSFLEFVKYSLLLRSYMPGWLLLNMWVKRTFDSFYVLQFIQAAIVNITFCHFALKYTKRVFLFLLLYFLWSFFFFNTEVMREAIAVSFCMFGMEFYMEGKKKLYILFAIMGLMFHISALVVFVFPFVNLRPQWKLLPLSVGISFIIWLLSDIVMGKLFVLGMGQMGALGSKMMHYSIMSSSFYMFFKMCLKNLIFPLIIMHYGYLWESSDEMKLKKKKLMSLIIFVGICVSSFDGLYRLWSYIQIFLLISLADFVFVLFRQKEHLIIRFITALGTIIFILHYQFYKTNSGDAYQYRYYLPYTSMVNKDINAVEFREAMSQKVNEENENQRDIQNL